MIQQGPRHFKLSVFLDSGRIEAWKWKVVQDLLSIPDLDVSFVMLRPSRLSHIAMGFEKLLSFPFWLYEKADWLIFSRKPHIQDAFKAVEPKDLKDGHRVLTLELGAPWERHQFKRLRMQLKNRDADIFLDLTGGALPKSLMHLPKYGTWSLGHADKKEYAGCPPFFWEMYDKKAASGVVLQLSTGDCDVDKVLYRSYSRTHLYSLFLSRNEAYWKATAFVSRRIQDLLQGGWEAIQSLDTYQEKTVLPKQRAMPNPFQMATFLGKILVRFLKEKQENASRYQFELAFRPRSATFMNASPAQYQRIKPPKSEFWADPFLFKHKEKTYLFFENYPYAERKGLISYMELTPDGRYTIPELVLERDYHLSYPFLLTVVDEIFMIPETSGNRTIELYRAVDFPKRWELAKVLMRDVDAHDTTVLYHNGKFWMFTNLVTSGGSVNDELFLFHSDSLWGEWTPHPKNPIVSDASTARPAGSLFFHQGRLIRPSQDCTKRYGYAVNFNQVEVLNETDYKERLLHKMVPDGFEDYKGVHTYNANDDYEVIDLGRYMTGSKRVAPACIPSESPAVKLPTVEVPVSPMLQADAVSVH